MDLKLYNIPHEKYVELLEAIGLLKREFNKTEDGTNVRYEIKVKSIDKNFPPNYNLIFSIYNNSKEPIEADQEKFQEKAIGLVKKSVKGLIDLVFEYPE